jgi:hypothetical protein
MDNQHRCLALCVNDGSRIKLGTNVTNPSSRKCTCDRLQLRNLEYARAPGPLDYGNRHRNTSRRALGLPAARLSDLQTYIETCRGLWNRRPSITKKATGRDSLLEYTLRNVRHGR